MPRLIDEMKKCAMSGRLRATIQVFPRYHSLTKSIQQKIDSPPQSIDFQVFTIVVDHVPPLVHSSGSLVCLCR